MKTGLVLEGGAMRGMFTAGVLDVFMESGIRFDGAIGVSAGAAFGVNYKTGQIGRAIRYNMRFCKDSRYCGLWALLRDGNIYSTDFCYGEVPLKHDPFDFEAFRCNPMPFYLVATDVETGEAVYHEYRGRDDYGFDWIRASSSMPLVSQMVEIEGRKLLDGGISDSLPLRYFESIGYKRNVVILTQPPMYEKKENGLLFAVRLMYRKYPALVRAMEERHLRYNEALRDIEEKERRGEILVIRPEAPLPVSRVEKNPERLRAAYNAGRQMACKRLSELRDFMEIKEVQEPYRAMQGVYWRKVNTALPWETKEEDYEYWFVFEHGCIHHNIYSRFLHCSAVPKDAEPIVFDDDALNCCKLHHSFRGVSLRGIYDDEDGAFLLHFSNGGIIQMSFTGDSDMSHFYRDIFFYTPEYIAVEIEDGLEPDYYQQFFVERLRVPVY